MEVNGIKVKLNIWDTAGQENFRALIPNFFRDANGAILVYDVSRPESLHTLNKWVDELQVYYPEKNIACSVVGNKIDKLRTVSSEKGQAFANVHKMMFAETSAKTQAGIAMAFEKLVQQVMALKMDVYAGLDQNIEPRLIEQVILRLGDEFNVRIQWNMTNAALVGGGAIVGGVIGGLAGGPVCAAIGALGGAAGVAAIISLRNLWSTIRVYLIELWYIVYNFLREIAENIRRAFELLSADVNIQRNLVSMMVEFIQMKLGLQVLFN